MLFWPSAKKAGDGKNSVCKACVENIFFVCGGKDAQNIRSGKKLQNLERSLNDRIVEVRKRIDSARINIVSMIPRRCDYLRPAPSTHIQG